MWGRFYALTSSRLLAPFFFLRLEKRTFIATKLVATAARGFIKPPPSPPPLWSISDRRRNNKDKNTSRETKRAEQGTERF